MGFVRKSTRTNFREDADSCKEDSWTTFSDRVSCTETVELQCGGMFPKPSPACGVYNDQTGVYLNTVPFDRVEPAANATYEVRLHRVFQVRDWLAFRNLTFRCHIIVLGTDWRKRNLAQAIRRWVRGGSVSLARIPIAYVQSHL
ncbi:hypothetical protein HPB48_004408 [Haemaphysalis longicornis]|uniref:Uncharacterized protein n=1 Tax=Haemaphysalis longicornis TaxID=44386 RepID=A0A9J6G0Y0_HAELO|nr:hypothetical protein HPB48_004408 [Haemaphysalis longicornis]